MKSRHTALLLLVTLLAACNRGGDSTGSGTSSGSGTKPKVVYIPKSSGNPYFDEVVRGFTEASKDLNFDYTTRAPSSSEATSQIPILKEQIQQGVDVIAISANSPDALNQVLDDAKSKGITVITVDADLVGNETHRDAAVLPADFAQVGIEQLKLLGSLMGYSGDFAILSATADAPNQNAWIAGINKALASDPQFSKMKLVATVYGDDESQKSSSECEALLAKYPNLKGIDSPTSVGLAASAQVLEQSGVYPGGPKAKGLGVALTGLSTPNQLRKFVDQGVVRSFQLWAPYNEGYIAAYVGLQIHSKKLLPTAGGSVDIPKLSKRTFSPKLELFGGPMVTFDKTDIGKYNF